MTLFSQFTKQFEHVALRPEFASPLALRRRDLKGLDALLPGQFPDPLGVYMEMVKSQKGVVSDMRLRCTTLVRLDRTGLFAISTVSLGVARTGPLSSGEGP